MSEEDKRSPQYISIEQAFGADAPNIHCPICGNSTYDGGEITACKHLVFAYSDITSELIFQNEQFEKRLNELKMDIDEFSHDNFAVLLKRMGYSNNLLVLEVTHGGMAYGPVWNTDIVGFDFQV